MNTLDFFPVLETDESTYSVLSRFHILSGSHSFTGTRSKLGLSNGASVVSSLPRHLREILAVLPLEYPVRSAEEIIANHTILPFYQFFRSEADSKQSVRIAVGEGSWIHLLGFIACRGQGLMAEHPFPAYCQSCIESDLERLGYSYWRRTHQLPSVRFCPWHRLPLQLACGMFYRHHRPFSGFLLPDQAKHPNDKCLGEGLSSNEQNMLLELADWSQKILAAKSPLMEVDPRPLFRRAIRKRGYWRGHKRDTAKLACDMSQFYGARLFEQLRPRHHSGMEWWLRHATRPTGHGVAQHPLRYLYLARFLFESFEELREEAVRHMLSTTQWQLPPPPPWAAQLPQLFAEHRSISKIAALVGSSFTRVRATAETMGIQSFKRAGSVGRATKDAVLSRLEKGGDVLKLAKEFAISETSVRDLLARNPESKRKRIVYLREAIRAKHRASVEQHLAKYSNTTRTSIRRGCPSAANWLLKYDRNWLFARIPKVEREPTSSQPIVPDDWTVKDEKAVQKIKTAVDSILAEDRPVQLTANRILAVAKIVSWFHYNKHRLPKTAAAISESSETLVHYHERKVRWGIKWISDRGLLYSQTALIAATGISIGRLKKMRSLIQAEIQRYPLLTRRIHGNRPQPEDWAVMEGG